MATAIVSCRAVTYVSSGTSSRASRKPCSTVPGLPNMYVIPSARSCSRIAKRPVFPGIRRLTRAGRLGRGVEPPLAQPVLEHLDHLLSGEVGVRRRAARDERVVDDDGGLVAVVAVVGAAGRGGVAEDPLQRVRRRAHDEVRAHEAGAVLVVVLDAVARDVLAGEDAVALLPVAGEGEAGDAVALGADQLVGVVEAEDQVVDALVVDEVDDRARPADDQDRVVLVGQLLRLRL